MKDDYTFDFLELGEEHSERELERAILARIEAFLREMGGMFAFLGSQSLGWLEFYAPRTFWEHLYGFTFFMLTGLQAVHVVGSLVALAVGLVLAWRGAFSWAHYGAVRNITLYWHFLDAVWLVLFGLLLASS